MNPDLDLSAEVAAAVVGAERTMRFVTRFAGVGQ
jgi:hypothetical protein